MWKRNQPIEVCLKSNDSSAEGMGSAINCEKSNEPWLKAGLVHRRCGQQSWCLMVTAAKSINKVVLADPRPILLNPDLLTRSRGGFPYRPCVARAAPLYPSF